ncbi:hypothetical protein R3P38DRAFT_2940676 [Favolaschia claudopus]|uniref:F-box domain-containing protein n=1 Tax=Favolaschia claudopus TaxID=2862362 RepID=A0AAW0BMK8_9AGAR
MPSNCDPETEQTTTCVDLSKAVESDNLPGSGTLPPDPEALHPTVDLPPTNPEPNDVDSAEMRRELDGILSKGSLVSSHVVSAVHTLPTELLSEIFDLCFPEELYQLATTSTPQDEFRRISQDHILQLAHVCCRWYNVAMDTPKLWANISIHVYCWRHLTPPVGSILNMLAAALERGRNHPLTLTVCTSASNQGAERALQLFVEHGHRWREFTVSAIKRPPVPLLHATTTLERLEWLRLYSVRRSDRRSWKDVEIFQDAPRLTKLDFSGYPSGLPKLPWNQIKSCTHHVDEIFGCLHHSLTVLRNAAPGSSYQLDLDLRKCRSSDRPWDSVCSEVQDLQICFSACNSATTERLFDSLTLPRVQSLALQGTVSGIQFPFWACDDSFLRLADRSNFYDHIFELTICRVIVSDRDILRCLEVLPRLKSLSITGWPRAGVGRRRGPKRVITDRLLLALVYSADVPALVPQLHELRLKPVHGKYSESVYVDLVFSRVRKVCDVDNNGAFRATFAGRGRHRLSSSVMEAFDELVSAGKLVFIVSDTLL